MKIGYVFSNLLMGGAQTFLSDLISTFSKKYDVKYCLLTDKNADPIIKKRLENFDEISPSELIDWADLIHMDGLVPDKDRKHFKPKWNSVVENIGSRRKFGLFKKITKYNIPPYLIACSKDVGKSLGVPNRIIYWGVDTERFKPLNIEKKYDVVIIGRMRPIKNHKLFLEICKKGDFSFLTIGGTHRYMEGHVNDIEKMARSQAREGIDYVAGFVPDDKVNTLLNQAKIAVVTSHSEALGYNSIEPMACGVPAVVRNVGGTSEAVMNEELLIPYDAPAEEYVKIIRKNLNNYQLRKDVREIIKKNFSYQNATTEINKIYLEIYNQGD